MKTIRKWVLLVFGFLLLCLFLIAIYHNFQLKNEEDQFTPMGEIVNVYGNDMHIYQEGSGDQTLVFMSGSGTSSPTLDFKALYSRLSDDFLTVVVEKIGYGFSELEEHDRSIEAILSETRRALEVAEIKPPYILVPHSMSGLEALYWAQMYPDEVEGIIGLDMATPKAYEDFSINYPLIRLSKFAADIGLIRFLPGIAESDAIKSGQLSPEEEELYKTVLYRRTLTEPMFNEIMEVKGNAQRVQSGDIPNIPIHLFVSNGEQTGFDAIEWIKNQEEFAQKAPKGNLTQLNVPHYIHNYAYEQIADEIKNLLR